MAVPSGHPKKFRRPSQTQNGPTRPIKQRFPPGRNCSTARSTFLIASLVVRPLASRQSLGRIPSFSNIRFMNSYRNPQWQGALLLKSPSAVSAVSAFLLAVVAGPTALDRTEAAANVVIWDTGSRFAGTIDLENRASWKAVPTELFVFEADPPKAASDPGYYGREYSFSGDVVVENRNLAAVFSSAQGRVVVYPRSDGTLPTGATHGSPNLAKPILEVVPLQS